MNCAVCLQSRKGENKHFDLPVKKKTDICTILYTSGTNGEPKGVMISNNSIITLVARVKRVLGSVKEALNESDVYLSYLPLAYIFDRAIAECFIHHGFWRGDVKLLVEDIAELKPNIFCAVPRVLGRIYSGLTETCTGTFVSIPGHHDMLGTVGPPMPNVDICLESVPEMGIMPFQVNNVEKYVSGGMLYFQDTSNVKTLLKKSLLMAGFTQQSVEFEPISGETQFDRIIAEAQQFEESVVILCTNVGYHSL
ncbi:Long chain acyl-CoA synthetase 4 [Abeliophyllum distichum]|uniref:Long chain acyl-CoA synthetase 4 n=1 Tax=Abeliophyllum distichum TaxID=126358 RepID=A0ABD1TVE2_9LAMI